MLRLGLVLIAAAGAPAGADTLAVQTPFTLPGGGGQAVVAVPRFDTLGGTRQLLRVRYRVEARLRANVAFENTMPFGITGWAHTPTYFAADLMPTMLGSWETPRVELSGSDGHIGGGPDYRAFAGLERLISWDTLVSLPEQSGFVGSGARPVHVQFIGGPWMGGDPDLAVHFTALPISGGVSAEYVYVRVPAPAAPLMLVPVALCALRRRR